MSESILSKKYIDGVYIPAGLLVVGTFILKRDYVGYAVALAALLGAWKFMSLRRSNCFEKLVCSRLTDR